MLHSSTESCRSMAHRYVSHRSKEHWNISDRHKYHRQKSHRINEMTPLSAWNTHSIDEILEPGHLLQIDTESHYKSTEIPSIQKNPPQKIFNRKYFARYFVSNLELWFILSCGLSFELLIIFWVAEYFPSRSRLV